jgi:trimethylamine:corrinoid methyltransferase-like protein
MNEDQLSILTHVLNKAGAAHNRFNSYKLFEKENITGIAKAVHRVLKEDGIVLLQESTLPIITK